MSNNNIPPPPPPDIPVLQPIGQGLDALMNKIVGAFDRVMTRMVNEGGLADMAEGLAAKASDIGNAVSHGVSDFSAFAGKPSTPDVPLQQKEISAPEVTPAISHDIAAQVASAGINVTNMQMAHVADSAYVSPPATPAQAVARSNDIGLG